MTFSNNQQLSVLTFQMLYSSFALFLITSALYHKDSMACAVLTTPPSTGLTFSLRLQAATSISSVYYSNYLHTYKYYPPDAIHPSI